MNQFQEFETHIVEMVFPNQTNHYGTLFGGHALELMDKSAFITASRYSRKSMVTACSERVDFKTPVKLGDLVEVVGRIIKSGKSSVTVEVDLIAEDLLSGDRQLCAQGRFVLVAVNKENKPLPFAIDGDHAGKSPTQSNSNFNLNPQLDSKTQTFQTSDGSRLEGR